MARKAKVGWPKRKPRSGLQRRELKAACGAKAFLDPKKLAYPVMKKGCNFDCQGVSSAYKRARQQRSMAQNAGMSHEAAYHNRIAKKAHTLGKRLGCLWARRPFPRG